MLFTINTCIQYNMLFYNFEVLIVMTNEWNPEILTTYQMQKHQ